MLGCERVLSFQLYPGSIRRARRAVWQRESRTRIKAFTLPISIRPVCQLLRDLNVAITRIRESWWHYDYFAFCGSFNSKISICRAKSIKLLCRHFCLRHNGRHVNRQRCYFTFDREASHSVADSTKATLCQFYQTCLVSFQYSVFMAFNQHIKSNSKKKNGKIYSKGTSQNNL